MKSTCVAAFLCFSVAAHAESDDWMLVGKHKSDFSLYYQPSSVRSRADGLKSVISLINYITSKGVKESLVTYSLYNCEKQSAQDQATFQFSEHWGQGERLQVSGVEEEWKRVLPHTSGEDLLRATCRTQIAS